MSPTMASENPNPQTSSGISTPIPTNSQQPRRSRPRVREVSSRFMSPVIKSPAINSKHHHNHSHNHIPSTPSESNLSKANYLRRSNTDFRPRYADENRPDQFNRSSVSPVRSSSKPRSAVKLFKEGSRTDTPVPAQAGPRSANHRSWDTAAAKLLQANGISDSDDGDCDSVKSEPIDNSTNTTNNGGNNTTNSNGYSNGNCGRVSTPCSRSMEFSFSSSHDHQQHQQQQNRGALNSVRCGGGGGKVARSLNLPPMPPGFGCSRPQGTTTGDTKKAAVKKGGSNSHHDDVHRLKLLHNHYLQWRFANAKAEACLSCQKMQSEKMLYSAGVKISEMKESVKNKRVEFRLLKEAKTLSTVLDNQMPCLDEWSDLEEAYSSSLLELTQGLQNISSRLPLMGNVKADVKELNEAMNSALKVAELICSEVQSFTPKAEEMDGLVSDLARVHSGEATLVQECGDLLSKTHLSQIEECSLRGQLIQFQKCRLNASKEEDQT
ncbi:Protein ENDOSPERM DEFECTIVE 1 [Bienertia sinuspersici]